MARGIQGLPLELLAEILGYVSIPDVLSFKQVEAIAHTDADQLSTDGIPRSTAASVMASSRLLYFNTR
jgi:hypothetical protein